MSIRIVLTSLLALCFVVSTSLAVVIAPGIEICKDAPNQEDVEWVDYGYINNDYRASHVDFGRTEVKKIRIQDSNGAWKGVYNYQFSAGSLDNNRLWMRVGVDNSDGEIAQFRYRFRDENSDLAEYWIQPGQKDYCQIPATKEFIARLKHVSVDMRRYDHVQ